MKKLYKLEVGLKHADLNAALSTLDHDNDGLIELSEFMALFDLGDEELEPKNELD